MMQTPVPHPLVQSLNNIVPPPPAPMPLNQVPPIPQAAPPAPEVPQGPPPPQWTIPEDVSAAIQKTYMYLHTANAAPMPINKNTSDAMAPQPGWGGKGR